MDGNFVYYTRHSYDDYYYEYPYSTRGRNAWYLNASLFLPFEELTSLYLGGNSIAGCIQDGGFERLFILDKLEILDLSQNHFNYSIFSSLSELISLKSLYLADNQFTESNPRNAGIVEQLSKLKNLETLDLQSNSFGNSILFNLHGFTSLKTLRLQNCGLKGTLDMLELSNLTNLKELYLGQNYEIESLKFSQGAYKAGQLRLDKLEVLDLSSNLINNSIFSSLAALSNLKSLYLGSNDLTGPLDIKALNAFSNLEELSMWGNQLTDFASSQELKLINLRALDLSGNLLSINSTLTFIAGLSNLKSLSFGIESYQMERSIHVKVFTELNALSKLEELYIQCGSYAGCSLELQSLALLPSSLKTLDLSGFSLMGTMTTPINEMHNITNLEDLSLTGSFLQTNFLTSIGELTSLKRLTLYECVIKSESQTPQGSGSGWLNLKNLESLNIESTSLENDFLERIGGMPSLKFMRLRDCGLNSTLHLQGFCELRHLRELNMRYNNLKGNLPACFSNLTALEKLDLSSNQFSGNISALKSLTSLEALDLTSNQFSGDITALEHLTSLQELRLSNNNLEIPSSLRPLFNLSKLKLFRADNNTVYAEIEMHSLARPTFQLEKISLSCCGDGGSFPKFFHHQHDLQHVDLSNIYFKGVHFPYWLLENNTNLYELTLTNCSLSGPFQLPLASHVDLFQLDVSNNNFNGSIPTEIGMKLPSLMFLNMSKNQFSGSIPSSFGDMNLLEYLDLSNNQLSGGIPEHLAMGCSSLQVLALSNNTLEGQLFTASFDLTNLFELQLNGNNFIGKIPDVLSNCSFLQILDLSDNHLFGRIPNWIGNLSLLSVLDVSKNQLFGRLPQMGIGSSLEQIAMSDNHLEGPIPVEFCKLNLNLHFLDLSMNNISGRLPSCFNPLQITEVHLSRNRLEGPLPPAFRNCSSLVTLNLGYNNLTGNIPNWIGKLSRLSYLLLKRNHFKGEIPVQLCELAHLSLIDLSHNNLSGGIPSCLKVTALNLISNQYIRSFLRNEPMQSNSSGLEEPIEYTIKSMPYSYKRRSLVYLSGIDLSCNKLTGEIPRGIENFGMVFALNLSHNSLTGSIPQALSDLMQIESLDLSYNNLSGKIPYELVKLHFLASFNVSYNNFSGKTPQRIQQFGTFDESSYLGNPLLCGPPLHTSCSPIENPSTPALEASSDGFIDMDVFYVSFIVSYVIVLLSIVAVLYINPYWRRAWFYHVERATTSCYYFVVDNLIPKRTCCGTM